MKFKHAFTVLLTLLFLLIPSVVGAAGEDGGNGSLMNGPFIILAIATLVLMIYYTVRD